MKNNIPWCLTMLLLEVALLVSAAASGVTLVEDSELAAFWTTAAGEATYDCRVEFSDFGRHWHKLVIFKEGADNVVLSYEPDFSRIQQFSNVDLTGDNVDEILTSWSYGMGSEAVVIQLLPTPRIVFHQPYKYWLAVEPRFQYPYLKRLQIFTGASNPDDVTLTSYEWSPEADRFVERESRTVHSHLLGTSSGSSLTGPARVETQWPESAIRIGSTVLLSRLLHRVDPLYPKEASLVGFKGEVVVELIVDEKGAVESARVVRGDPNLSQAVLEAVHLWRFEPLIIEEHAVKMRASVTLRFPEDFRRE